MPQEATPRRKEVSVSGTMHGTLLLSFRLQVEDDWPPVSLESVPVLACSDGYQCLEPPLYVKDLAVGDVIWALVSDEGVVDTWCHVHRSNHSTVWLLRLRSPNRISTILQELRLIGCNTVSLEDVGSHSVDVPGEIDMSSVDRILASLDSEAVAVAFPAVRHT